MPVIDPTQYLMDALSTLTGGLVNDLKTLILGMVVCAFLLMALDYLKDLFGDTIETFVSHRNSNKYFENARFAKEARDNSVFGSAEYDFNNALYRRFIRKSVDSTERSWK